MKQEILLVPTFFCSLHSCHLCVSASSGELEISSVSKKKRVHFGAPLSPEFFDKTLPPSTPLQKGATPACPPSSTGRKPSLLKTPQRYEPPLPQPDFGSPGRNGASPVLTTHTYSDGGADCDEVFLHNQKVRFKKKKKSYNKISLKCCLSNQEHLNFLIFGPNF